MNHKFNCKELLRKIHIEKIDNLSLVYKLTLDVFNIIASYSSVRDIFDYTCTSLNIANQFDIKLLSMFSTMDDLKIDMDEFNKLLYNSKMCLSGSFLMQHLLSPIRPNSRIKDVIKDQFKDHIDRNEDFKSLWKSNDLDIYVMDSECDDLMESKMDKYLMDKIRLQFKKFNPEIKYDFQNWPRYTGKVNSKTMNLENNYFPQKFAPNGLQSPGSLFYESKSDRIPFEYTIDPFKPYNSIYGIVGHRKYYISKNGLNSDQEYNSVKYEIHPSNPLYENWRNNYPQIKIDIIYIDSKAFKSPEEFIQKTFDHI